MKTYPSAKIRNVALVGHGGAGKTTLTEALLHMAGVTQRLGRVEEGTTASDFDPEEHKRGISVGLSVLPFEYEGHKVNILDCPGYADFVGDVIAAMRVADMVLVVISAVDGVEVQAEIVWKLAEQRGLPRAVFVNKLDRDRASFSRTLDDLKEKFGAGIAPLQLPIGEEADLSGVVDLLTDQGFTYAAGAKEGTAGEVPDSLAEQEHEVHDSLVEGIVVADDELMERYLSDEAIDAKELAATLAKGIAAGSVFPVLCGSATKLIGIDRLAKFLVEEGPAPSGAADGPPAAFVFKTIADPYVGRVNLFKVVSGQIRPDAVLTNGRTMADERLHQLVTMRGKEQEAGAKAGLVYPSHGWLRFGYQKGAPQSRYKEIYETSGLPLILFQYPDATKATYDLDTQLEIAGQEGVFATKNGVRNMKRWDTEIPVLRETYPDLQILTCHDEYLLPTMFDVDGLWSATATRARAAHRAHRRRQGQGLRRRPRHPRATAAGDEERLPPRLPHGRHRRPQGGLVTRGILDHATVRPPLLPLPEGAGDEIARP